MEAEEIKSVEKEAAKVAKSLEGIGPAIMTLFKLVILPILIACFILRVISGKKEEEKKGWW